MQQLPTTSRSASALAAASWRPAGRRARRRATMLAPVPPGAGGLPRVGLLSARLDDAGVARLETSAAASLAAGARHLIVAVATGGTLDDAAARALLRVHRAAAGLGAVVTLATPDGHLRDALAGLPVPGGAHVVASAPAAMREAAGELAPEGRRAI